MGLSPQQRAKLRVCASCEWIYFGEECPKCGFCSYGARFVYGDKCYIYQYSQKPWLDKKITDLHCELFSEIYNTNPIKKKDKTEVCFKL